MALRQNTSATDANVASTSRMTVVPSALADGLAAAFEHKLLVLAPVLVSAITGLILALSIPKYYESATRVLIDPRGLQVVEKDVTQRTTAPDQNLSVVESEMRVLTSDIVLRGVIDKLQLIKDPEFNGSWHGPLAFAGNIIDHAKAKLRQLAGASPEPSAPTDIIVLNAMKRSVFVRREPQSFVIDLYARSRDPQMAAKLADAVASEYTSTRFAAQSDALRRASDSMTGLLEEQRRRLETAEAKVEKFRAANDIIGVSGRLVNEQQLSEINSRLVIAQGESAKANTRLEQLNRLKRSGDIADATSEALGSAIMISLRNQYAAQRRREAALKPVLLPSHPVFKQVQQELQDIERLIAEELARLAQGAKLDLERARANEASIEKSLNGQKKLALTTNAKQVELRELERDAEANRSVYAWYLGRSREINEQRQVNSSLVFVLSPAIPAQGASGIPASLMLLGASLAGLGIGLGAALLRDHTNPLLNSARHLQQISGRRDIDVVAGLADVSIPEEKAGRHKTGLVPAFVTTDPDAPISQAIRRLRDRLRTETADSFPAVILVTSAAQEQGRSTIALNLALEYATSSDRVLLIDSDLENRTLTGAVQADDLPGLLDVMAKRTGTATVFETKSDHLTIMPAGQRRVRVAALSQNSVAIAMRNIGTDFDIVVVDCSTLQSANVVAAWSSVADSIVVVARLGVTGKAELAKALNSMRAFRQNKWRPVLLQDT